MLKTMKRRFTGNLSIHTLAVLAITFSSTSNAASLTYSINDYPSLQGSGPSHLSGTITTDGTIGVLTAANITHWAFEVRNSSSTLLFSASGNGAGVGVYVAGVHAVKATATSITLSYPEGPTTNPLELTSAFELSGTNGDLYYERALPSSGGKETYWGQDFANVSVAGQWLNQAVSIGFPTNSSGDWLIAGSQTAAVPEPASVAMLGIGIVCIFGWRRRQILVGKCKGLE